MKRIFSCLSASRTVAWTVFVLLTLLSTACRRELEYNYHPFCEISVRVDWSAMDEKPTGMSVYLYPEDGSEPIVKLTNQVDETRLSVREGTYNVLVINQSISEFGSITFQGMDRFSTAKAIATRVPNGSDLHGLEEPEVYGPELLAIATHIRLVVTEQMVSDYQAQVKAEAALSRQVPSATTLQLTARPLTFNATVHVHVSGIQNVRSVRGRFSGMASGCLLVMGTPLASTSTYMVEQWDITHDDTDYTQGTLTGRFTTFGLVEEAPSTAAAVSTAAVSNAVVSRWAERAAATDNLLSLDILLVDNQTVVSTLFSVGDRIEELKEELTIRVEVGTEAGSTPPSEGQDNPSVPLPLPDVKPESGSSNGFDATVDDWGEEIDIDIDV